MNIKKLTKEYTAFRKNSAFKVKELIHKDGKIFFDDCLVQDETGKKYAGDEKVLNNSYGQKDSLARAFSNLFPCEFVFRGKSVASIEGVLQGIKQKDKNLQNKILKYSGLDAYHCRAVNFFDDWRKQGALYWQGKAIERASEEYQLFLDELFVAAYLSPLRKKLLLASGSRYLLHNIGITDPKETVLTREEFEIRLNTVREFLLNYDKN